MSFFQPGGLSVQQETEQGVVDNRCSSNNAKDSSKGLRGTHCCKGNDSRLLAVHLYHQTVALNTKCTNCKINVAAQVIRRQRYKWKWKNRESGKLSENFTHNEFTFLLHSYNFVSSERIT